MSTHRVWFCDRCGAEGKGMDRPEGWEPLQFGFVNQRSYDTCPTCSDSLEDWLHGELTIPLPNPLVAVESKPE